MWTYIIRRVLLMIPTLFGVTLVSFGVMQLAPGDPVVAQLSGGNQSQNGMTSEAVKQMRHELNLDKPWFLNFRYFADYREPIRQAAHFLARSDAQIVAELPALARHEEPVTEANWQFARSLGIPDFEKELANPATYGGLGHAISAYTRAYCDELGDNAVPAAIELLQSPDATVELKSGLIHVLNDIKRDPFMYTYSKDPSDAETPEIQAAWRIWWDRNRKKFEPLDADTRQTLVDGLKKLVDAQTPSELLDQLQYYSNEQAPFFVETLLGNSTLLEKVVSALVLRQVAPEGLKSDVATDTPADQVNEVAENWEGYYAANRNHYEPTTVKKLWYIVSDTQYAYLLWRLLTFNFGKSALPTRELVSENIWRHFIVSAPLMFWSQIFLYLIAVPLGILCAVYRSSWIDRLVSFLLYLLYSIPPFVAAMLLLKYFCYGGDYPQWFPNSGLHADGAHNFGFWDYSWDYMHHAFLPIVCLSLFGLASMAMYARSSLLDVINQDYIRTARAKGLSSRAVIFKHALRNSLIPIVTLFSTILPAMLGGSVLIEQLFNISGLGRLNLEAIVAKDIPTIMALTYIEAIVVLVSILLTDLMYVVIDPRISFEGRGKAA